MHQKCTRFKIVVENLDGRWLAWPPACGARLGTSEERKLLSQKEIVLVPDKWVGFFLSPDVSCSKE